MKTIVSILTAAALTLSAAPSHASARIDQFCGSIGELAGLIMEYRQQGRRMSEILGSAPESDRPTLTAYALQAFDHPQWTTPELQQAAVAAFRETAEVECYKEVTAYEQSKATE